MLAENNSGTNPKRCALVSPYNEALSMIPPIQLGYLASCLENKGWNVEIFDYKLPGARHDELTRQIVSLNPMLIGVSAMTIQMPGAILLTRELRKLLPETVFVFGGVHATALPEFTLRETTADYIISGEAEESFPAFAEAVACGRAGDAEIPGLSFISGGGTKSFPRAAPVMNLDSIPFPAWKMIPPERYSAFPWQLYKRRKIVAPLLTSRGCPYSCTFCCATMMHGPKLRYRSPENITAEMSLLIRDHGVEEFQVVDDNFAGNRKNAIAICNDIARKHPGIVWKTPNGIRADSVDGELISAMKSAGCYETGLGIESGHPDILGATGKKINLTAVRDKIRLIKRHGIEVYGFFILGLPGETRETLSETLRFMLAGFDHVSLSFCVPYPGCELYNKLFGASAAGRPDWDRFIHYNPFPGLSALSERELKDAMKRALVRFYIHPARLLKMVNKIRTIPLKYTARLLKKYIGRGKARQ